VTRRAGGSPAVRLTGLIALSAAALVVASPARAQSRFTVKIANQSPLSGELGSLGEGIRLGAQLAVDRLKAPLEKAGSRVELVPFDDQARPDVGVANAKAIVADRDVLVVIGHLNPRVGVYASEIYKDADLAVISPADSSPLFTDRGLPAVNRVCGRDDVAAQAAAQFARETVKARSVYIVHGKSPPGPNNAEIFRDAVRKLGVQVLGFEGSEERESFDPILAPIKAKPPDLLFFTGEYAQAALLFRQAREQGIKARFLGFDPLDAPRLLERGGEAVAGALFATVVGGVRAYPQAREFAEEYRRQFGKEPEPFAAQAYDATAVALKAVEAALKEAGGKPPAREAVARAVRRVKHGGITGSVEFDDQGDLRKASYLLYEVARDGSDSKLVRRIELAPPARNP
jgi:branched-chain amino acid transport system substrate-binding protein